MVRIALQVLPLVRVCVISTRQRIVVSQCGLNEHTNGLIREYFQKKTALQDVTDKQIIDVQNKLNSRPRKVLGYKTPAGVFFGKMMETYSAA